MTLTDIFPEPCFHGVSWAIPVITIIIEILLTLFFYCVPEKASPSALFLLTGLIDREFQRYEEAFFHSAVKDVESCIGFIYTILNANHQNYLVK